MRKPIFLLLILACLPVLGSAGTLEDATNLVKEGRYEQAVPKFEEAARQDPGNAEIYLSLGLAYQALKRYPEAIGALEHAAGLSPASAHPLYSLALLYEAMAASPASAAGKSEDPRERASARKEYLLKAKNAWENVLRVETDPHKRARAQAHLAKTTELIK